MQKVWIPNKLLLNVEVFLSFVDLGDVLLHCVVDAILGALGLPDIGQIFPDSDPKWKGAPSSVFMKEAVSSYGVANSYALTKICYLSYMNHVLFDLFKMSHMGHCTDDLGFCCCFHTGCHELMISCNACLLVLFSLERPSIA